MPQVTLISSEIQISWCWMWKPCSITPQRDKYCITNLTKTHCSKCRIPLRQLNHHLWWDDTKKEKEEKKKKRKTVWNEAETTKSPFSAWASQGENQRVSFFQRFGWDDILRCWQLPNCRTSTELPNWNWFYLGEFFLNLQLNFPAAHNWNFYSVKRFFLSFQCSCLLLWAKSELSLF